MKVGVTGYGVVGKATADVLRRLGHTIVVSDTNPMQVEAAFTVGFRPRQEADGVEVDFLCVPETCLEAALTTLPSDTLAVIRATVTPGTTDRLSERFGRPLAFMPEFLREATAQWDAMNPQFVLIGTNDEEQGAVLAELFAPLLVQVIQVTPPVAEMVKLTLNAYLHMLISFWNEIYLICERAGLPSHVVGKIASLDPRVAAYGAVLHGDAVGGRCLPKDLLQLINFGADAGYSADLLQEVQRVNEKILTGERSGNELPEDLTHLMPPAGVLHLRW